jgi:hypothetical protein
LTAVGPSLAALVGLPQPGVALAAAALAGAWLWALSPVADPSRHSGWPATGTALGLVGVLAWITGALAGWNWGLSITGPSRSLFEAVFLSNPGSLSWGAAMLVGLVLGSWASARSWGPVVWRAPGPPELARRFLGGLLMGAGGTLAGGCNIGNALTGLSILSVHSVIATAAIVAGGALAIRLTAGSSGNSRLAPAG